MSRVMILGAGFAGLNAARKMMRCNLIDEILLIDRKQNSEFLPLLPDTLSSRVRKENVQFAINNLESKRVKFLREEAVNIDIKEKKVVTDKAEHEYDFLIISCGAEVNFYGNEEALKYSYKIYSVEDAVKIQRVFQNNQFSNFIIIGGGYTGIETATNIWRYYNMRGEKKNIHIIERSDHILGPLPEAFREYVMKNLGEMGIDVITKTNVQKISQGRISLDNGKDFDNSMIIWSAGVKAASVLDGIDAEKGPQGRIKVNEYLQINDSCYVVGDAAHVEVKGRALRMAAMFSLKQGRYAAENIIRSIKDQPLKKYYEKIDLGYVVPMANNKACGKALGLNVYGFMGIFLHFFMCIYRSFGFANKINLIKNIIFKKDI